MSEEQEFRDQITADFKAGEIGIENGWLVEYNAPCPSPCAGVYGCPPSCAATPIFDLWKVGQPATAEQGTEEPETRLVDLRDPACVKAWPECHSFGYDPACCRFPKSCSAGEWKRMPAEQEGERR